MSCFDARVSRSTLPLLRRDATGERLRPTRVGRHGPSYRLILCGDAGSEIEIFAQRVTLAL